MAWKSGEGVGVVNTAESIGLVSRHAAKFGVPHDEGVFESHSSASAAKAHHSHRLSGSANRSEREVSIVAPAKHK